MGTALASWIPSAFLLQGPLAASAWALAQASREGLLRGPTADWPQKPYTWVGSLPRGTLTSQEGAHIPTLTIWENEMLS